MMKSFSTLISISLLLLTSCFVGEELPPDQQTWEYATPTEVGLSDSDFFSVNTDIILDQYGFIGGMIIIKDGQLIFENYFSDTLNRQSLLPIGQSSITFTIAAIGVAEDFGLLEITDPIQQYLPEYTQVFEDDVRKQNITIEQLMTHTSGFSWNETVVPFYTNFNILQPNPDNNLVQMFSSNNWVEFIISRSLEAEPGIRYNFNSGGGVILAKIIENASNQRFDMFLIENLLGSINATNFTINQDPSGNFDGGQGISVSLIDWTKLAYLTLQGGIRDGRRIIDPNFVDASTSLQVPISLNFNFGYGWRLLGDDFQNTFPFDKDNVYYSKGEIGQDQYIITEENMIISIYAENFFRSQSLPSDLFQEIALLIP